MERLDRAVLNAAPVADFRGNDGSLLAVLKTLLFFTFLMITLPIGLYFGTKSYVFEDISGRFIKSCLTSNENYVTVIGRRFYSRRGCKSQHNAFNLEVSVHLKCNKMSFDE
ncbi:vacuolar ATPase assembly integral membrane protein vma21 isoform X1 [Rhincodon typus]|uniref:vacuolar ATPase assembly integral membrane protein vma21 isoform X1 n=1 Tax=Rhincodon typus TaxID=259920 RepID=UPI00202EA28C|nr:vacuolar ATPase assembly integral membrane protein vma21 isoform X1 [Rhincodon typus]